MKKKKMEDWCLPHYYVEELENGFQIDEHLIYSQGIYQNEWEQTWKRGWIARTKREVSSIIEREIKKHLKDLVSNCKGQSHD